jgi:hypothetical protein
VNRTDEKKKKRRERAPTAKNIKRTEATSNTNRSEEKRRRESQRQPKRSKTKAACSRPHCSLKDTRKGTRLRRRGGERTKHTCTPGREKNKNSNRNNRMYRKTRSRIKQTKKGKIRENASSPLGVSVEGFTAAAPSPQFALQQRERKKKEDRR